MEPDADFLGFNFSAIELEQRAAFTEILTRYPHLLSGYSFASLLAWASIFHHRWLRVGPETVLISCIPDVEPEEHLLQPLGLFTDELQESILQRARKLPYPLKIISVDDEFLQRHPAFISHFKVISHRDNANYLYTAADLAELAGRKYAKKRNLIAQATRLYTWSVEPLTPEHSEECLLVSDDIATKRSTITGVTTLQQETRALEYALSFFGPLQLQGLLLRIEGQPVGFSIFDWLSPTTAVVLFERALRSHHGLYQTLNQETSRRIAAQGFAFINREEDLGDPGLRQAKLSYYPTRLEMSYTLIFGQ